MNNGFSYTQYLMTEINAKRAFDLQQKSHKRDYISNKLKRDISWVGVIALLHEISRQSLALVEREEELVHSGFINSEVVDYPIL